MTPLLLCTSILVVTLTASGLAKAKDPSRTVEGILNLGLDSVAPLKLTPAVLPWAELVLAAGLLFAPGPLFPVFAIASCALMVFYLVVIARALATGRTEGCNCFGKKSAAPVSRYTLIRNIALTIAGILTVVASFAGGKAVVYELVGLNGSGWLWAVGAGLIALTLWAIQRGESLAEPAPDIPEVVLPSAADESEDYVRVPIPYASIYTTDGRVTTLRDMSRVQARVLFFASPTCGSCTPILKTIPRWQKLLPQLGLHPVFSSEEKIRQAHKLEKLDEGVEALVDPKHAAMHNFGRGTPMAVILGSDGMLAGGPVAGTSDVKQLMDDLLVEFGAIKDPNAPKEAQPAQAAASASAAGASEQRAPVQGGSATQAPARPTAAHTRETGCAARAGPGCFHAAKRRSSAAECIPAAARSAPTGYGSWGCARAEFDAAPKNREEYGSTAACRGFFNGIERGRCTAAKAAEGSGRLLSRSESSNVSPGSFCRSGVWGLGAGHCSGADAEAQRCHRAPDSGGAAESLPAAAGRHRLGPNRTADPACTCTTHTTRE